MDLHEQDDPEQEELDALIPWDGKVNGRCIEFTEKET
jgi:hypothetical protein